MIKLFGYLFQTCRREILWVAVLGALGGGSSAVIIAVVNSVLHGQLAGPLPLAGFTVAVLIKLVSGLISSLVLLHMTQNSVLRLCDELCRQVIAAPFRRIEEVGVPRILASLTDDVTVLSSAVQEIPALMVNTAVLAGCAIYLACLSWPAAVLMLTLVLLGGLCYRSLLVRVHIAFESARDTRDTLFGHFRSMTEGIKELKLNAYRRESFFANDLGPAVADLRKHSLIAVRDHIKASALSQSVFYGLLGILLFVLPAAGIISWESVTAYVFVAVFTTAPLWAVIAGLPTLGRGQTALDRIEAVKRALEAGDPGAEPLQTIDERPLRLDFQQVEFSYRNGDNGGGFALGPIDLTLHPGELVFVTGGNGSGKSTFVKLLTGLYRPVAGEIRINGQTITPADEAGYRELFSVVYSDFFLFDRLPDRASDELQRRAYGYLSTLRLDQKVQIAGNSLSTTKLSQGQRRRLALLMAYIEDRPIYVLDEWAADQDPNFRDIFYKQLLPDLKRRGKTVIVVTHDDRYYHLGDRVVNLDYGKIRAQTESPCLNAAG